MSASSLAVRVETWLSSTRHVKVPVTWLGACIDWILQENFGGNLTEAHIKEQVFEQWLLTDLRDLEYTVLPNCIFSTPKGELNGFYSIQIDSLVDVSQPAYSQLQKIRGTNTVNEEVTANTQVYQKPWEAKPTRMLMLQLTDGIHQIQGMEYQPVPVLHSNLPPGTKMLIQGTITYRLGFLLLKPENVKLLGGEVDALLEEYAQKRVLARLIGEDENPNLVRENNCELDISRPGDEAVQVLGPSDEELLASLENDEFTINNETSLESGYCSRSVHSNALMKSFPSSNESCPQQDPGILLTEANKEQRVQDTEYIDGDLDDFLLEDVLLLEEEIQQELEVQAVVMNRNTNTITERFPHLPRTSHSSSLNCTSRKDGNNENLKSDQPIEEKSFRRELCVTSENGIGPFSIQHNVQHITDSSDDFSCASTSFKEQCNEVNKLESSKKICNVIDSKITNTKPVNVSKIDLENQQIYCVQPSNEAAEKCKTLGLDTPPFTYISILLAKNPQTVTTVKVKAFIVTLTGILTSSSGFWNVTAKISDGTAYLEVDFTDEILSSLIGFSVPEMKSLNRDPCLRAKLKNGLQACQRELIDLCCLMTIEFNPSQSKAKVLVLQDVNTNDVEKLKKRLER
uniref:RecQ-mediated genome instability protein 1 n=1 Tax=Sphenodon punctatus TaxID=8508 RepID=A0A8D0L2Q3_SPHPU